MWRITRTPTGMPVVTYSYDLAGRLTGISTPTVSGDRIASTVFVLGAPAARRLLGGIYKDAALIPINCWGALYAPFFHFKA